MNEQESQSHDYLRPPLWHGKLAFGKVSLGLTLQKRDTSEKSTQHFRQVSLFALDEPFEQKSPVIRRRLLVLGLYLSFLACVTGLWLTANVTSDLGHKLPSRIVNFIANQPVVVLLVPLLVLFGCYFLLRLMTYEILAWPERFLDERQQMVRDRAHRNAYKFVKVACLLVPLYLCLHAVLWTAQVPAVSSPEALTLVQPADYVFEMDSHTPIQVIQVIHLFPQQIAGQAHTLQRIISLSPIQVFNAKGVTLMAPPTYWQTYTRVSPVPTPTWPDSPASLFLYYGTLLLSLLLMATALPMCIVAWKERL